LDGIHFRLDMLIWYMFLKGCQSSFNFWKSVSIRLFSEQNY